MIISRDLQVTFLLTVFIACTSACTTGFGVTIITSKQGEVFDQEEINKARRIGQEIAREFGLALYPPEIWADAGDSERQELGLYHRKGLPHGESYSPDQWNTYQRVLLGLHVKTDRSEIVFGFVDERHSNETDFNRELRNKIIERLERAFPGSSISYNTFRKTNF